MSDFYRPLREEPPHIEADVILPDPERGGRYRVHMTCAHLLYRQFAGLDDSLIGEIRPIADPTGLQEMKARRVKLKAVLRKVSNLDPDVYPGGEISDKEELGKWIDADENANAVWAGWSVYVNEIDNPKMKSEAEGGGDRSGENAGTVEAPRPNAYVSDVRRIRADGGGGGGEMPHRDGNGSLPNAGSSGVETESHAGAGL